MTVTAPTLFLFMLLIVYSAVWRATPRLRSSVMAFLVFMGLLAATLWPLAKVAAPHASRVAEFIRGEVEEDLRRDYPEMFGDDKVSDSASAETLVTDGLESGAPSVPRGPGDPFEGPLLSSH